MSDLNERFEQDPRRQQELRARPLIDQIYRNRFGNDIEIERDKHLLLDKEHGIDAIITFPNGMIITGQEKALSHQFASFNSLTVEYENDPLTHEQGDWFNLKCQFYFCGYLNREQTTFTKYIIVDWLQMVLATQNNILHWNDNRNQDGHARASFRWVSMYDIPQYCTIDIKGNVFFGERK